MRIRRKNNFFASFIGIFVDSILQFRRGCGMLNFVIHQYELPQNSMKLEKKGA